MIFLVDHNLEENITTPPKEVQADIATTARDLENSMLEIEDES